MNNRIEKTDQQWRQELTPEAYEVLRHKRHRAPLHRRLRPHQGRRRLPLRRLRRGAVPLRHQVRLGHRLAELHRPRRTAPTSSCTRTAASSCAAPRSLAPAAAGTWATSSMMAPRPPGRPLLHQLGTPSSSTRLRSSRPRIRVGRRPAPPNPKRGDHASGRLWLLPVTASTHRPAGPRASRPDRVDVPIAANSLAGGPHGVNPPGQPQRWSMSGPRIPATRPGIPLSSCSPRSARDLVGADDEVADGAADQHLTWRGEAADARADVDREAADVVIGA